jgi:hypothetical protein
MLLCLFSCFFLDSLITMSSGAKPTKEAGNSRDPIALFFPSTKPYIDVCGGGFCVALPLFGLILGLILLCQGPWRYTLDRRARTISTGKRILCRFEDVILVISHKVSESNPSDLTFTVSLHPNVSLVGIKSREEAESLASRLMGWITGNSETPVKTADDHRLQNTTMTEQRYELKGVRFVREGDRLTFRLDPWSKAPWIAIWAALSIFMFGFLFWVIGLALGRTEAIDRGKAGEMFLVGISFCLGVGGCGLLFGALAWHLLSAIRSRILDRGSDSYRRGKLQLCHLRDLREIVVIRLATRKFGIPVDVTHILKVRALKLSVDQVQRLVAVDELDLDLWLKEDAQAVADEIARFIDVPVVVR